MSAGNDHQIRSLLDRLDLTDAFDQIRAVGPSGTPAGEPKQVRLLDELQRTQKPAVLFEDSARYLALVAGLATRVGVKHQFNRLDGSECELLVSHQEPELGATAWQHTTSNARHGDEHRRPARATATQHDGHGS